MKSSANKERIAQKYRIVSNGTYFKAQKHLWYGWCDVLVGTDTGDLGYRVFKTHEEAEKFTQTRIEQDYQDELKKQKYKPF